MFKQELLNAVTLREANCGIDNKNALNRVLTNAHVPLYILVSVVTSDVGLRPFFCNVLVLVITFKGLVVSTIFCS